MLKLWEKGTMICGSSNAPLHTYAHGLRCGIIDCTTDNGTYYYVKVIAHNEHSYVGKYVHVKPQDAIKYQGDAYLSDTINTLFGG